jgi:hypothetical protein
MSTKSDQLDNLVTQLQTVRDEELASGSDSVRGRGALGKEPEARG